MKKATPFILLLPALAFGVYQGNLKPDNRIAIINLKSNAVLVNTDKAQAVPEGHFGGQELADQALAAFVAELGKVQQWRVADPAAVAASTAVKTFFDRDQKKIGAAAAAARAKQFTTPGGMVPYVLDTHRGSSDPEFAKDLKAIAALCKDLGVDSVALVTLEYALMPQQGGAAIPKVGVWLNVVDSTGKLVLSRGAGGALGTAPLKMESDTIRDTPEAREAYKRLVAVAAEKTRQRNFHTLK